MSIIRAATTNEGNDPTYTSTTQSNVIDYQPVTSHGNAAVSDGDTKTTVAYYPGYSLLTPGSSTAKSGIVHLPIPNPPQLSTQLILQDILVNFETKGDAQISSVTLYYDGNKVVNNNPAESDTFYIAYTAQESINYAYVEPKGISVALTLSFPANTASVKLYSVTLIYQAASS
ncbi:hypothetical protein F5884DRAFT_373904 [Xylogone sp. PMI_703]|nr:hypothetical protein F5884DRAFT_373904 [Xylogone sp. PMI_703]